MITVLLASLGAVAGVQRRENPGHLKQLQFLREENERLEEEVSVWKEKWDVEAPQLVVEKRLLQEAAAAEAALKAEAADAKRKETEQRVLVEVEKTRQLEEHKQVWELSVQREEEARFAAEAEAKAATAKAEELRAQALVAEFEATTTQSRAVMAQAEAAAAEAETSRWTEIRSSAEANATSARSMAEYASAERDRLEAERQALELAAHEAEDRRRQAELDVQRAGFETATAEAKLLADQLLTEEKDRRLELERLASLEATARLEAETATARLKEQEAKQWAAEAELASAEARKVEARAIATEATERARAAESLREVEVAKQATAQAAADQAKNELATALARAEEAEDDRKGLELALEKAGLDLKLAQEARLEAEAVAEQRKAEAETAKVELTALDKQLEVAGTEAQRAVNDRVAAQLQLKGIELAEVEKTEQAHIALEQSEADLRIAEARRALAEAETEQARIQAEHEMASISAKAEAEAAALDRQTALMREQDQRQRERDELLISKQEESTLRVEAARLAQERAKEEAKAQAEAEGRIRQERENEDVKLRLIEAQASADRDKWLATITTSLTMIGSGAQDLVENHLERVVLALVGLAVGYFLSKEGIALARSEIQRFLGQPRLVRETSRRSFVVSVVSCLWRGATCCCRRGGPPPDPLSDVILHKDLDGEVRALARATRNAKRNRAPLRHALFYGPPGTGKTMLAMRLAKHLGLDYAIMSGGDVAPLGKDAVAEMHKLFEWAKKSPRGVLLFIDEAEAFLGSRGRGEVSEDLRNVLSALLYQTGTQSSNYMMVLATNRPEDLDSAITDRIDESLCFPLPDLLERQRMVNQYFAQYILARGVLLEAPVSDPPTPKPRGDHSKVGQPSNQRADQPAGGPPGGAPLSHAPPRTSRSCCQKMCCRRGVPLIHIMPDVDESLLMQVAKSCDGFSGRAISKFMLKIQGTVYGQEEMTLDSALMQRVLGMEVERNALKRAEWSK